MLLTVLSRILESKTNLCSKCCKNPATSIHATKVESPSPELAGKMVLVCTDRKVEDYIESSVFLFQHFISLQCRLD